MINDYWYNRLQVAILDVDGVLTDGIYQITQHDHYKFPLITKSFHTRDFYGIEQLLRNDIKVVILSQSHDNVIRLQIDRICSHSEFWKEQYENHNLIVVTEAKNKKLCLDNYLKSHGIGELGVAYMGDAENDIECLEYVEFPACPNDAIDEVKEIDGIFISSKNGGKGAVYEFCKYILKKRKENE